MGWEVPSALMLPVKAYEGEEGKAEHLQPVPPTGAALPVPGILWSAGGQQWMDALSA